MLTTLVIVISVAANVVLVNEITRLRRGMSHFAKRINTESEKRVRRKMQYELSQLNEEILHCMIKIDKVKLGE